VQVHPQSAVWLVVWSRIPVFKTDSELPGQETVFPWKLADAGLECHAREEKREAKNKCD
jgi:hypothetical protein